MDGDSHNRRKYDSSGHSTGAGIGQHTMRQLQGGSIDRFRHHQPPAPRPTAPDGTIQPPDRGNPLSTYGGFEYAESPSYNAPSFQGGGPLQGGNLPYQADFAAASSRSHPSQATQQHHDQQGQHQRVLYETGMVYNVAPPAQHQSPYDTTSNYQPRQSAAIEVLATQFGGPQYFPSDEPTGPGVSGQYLTAQVHPAPYSQPPSAMRTTANAPYPEDMPEFNPTVASEPLQPQAQEVQRETPNVDDGYNQYQQTLRRTFECTRVGQLVEASNSLLEISEWLISNVCELGLDRDEQDLHAERIKLWHEFNLCWLALFQKQKDVTLEMVERGIQPNNILTTDTLNTMGEELIRLCDRLEQYGLVDYEIGVWEEELLSVLSQCLDILEQDDGARPSSNRQAHPRQNRPRTATSRR